MGSGPSSAKVTHRTIGEKFDTSKFIGKWYEIAHIPNSFQTSCDHSVINYTKGPADTIKVTNSCIKVGSSPSNSIGKVRYENPNDPSKMQVQFEGLLGTLFAGWIDLWVYDTDYESYAIVGNPDGYVSILNREQTMTFCRYADLKEKASTFGFQVDWLKPDTNYLRKCTAGEVAAEAQKPAAK